MEFNFQELAEAFLSNCKDNIINENNALSKELIGIEIIDSPIFGFAHANDKLFNEYKKDSIIGSFHKLPEEWLPSGKTVVSIFAPFTEKIKADNAKDMDNPSLLWLHGRIEGQKVINKLCNYLAETVRKEGFKTVIPSQDERFSASISANTHNSSKSTRLYTSNWSERHAAYACGLGTFGLSKGLITDKGVAGRFSSFVTELIIEPKPRQYTGIYDYCSNCGKCIRNCPVNAISFEKGKEHGPCSEYLDELERKYHPYYGCGKCQVGVPCENHPAL